VKTRVTLEKSGKRKIRIWINGRASRAETSRWVAEKLLPDGWSASIEHTAHVPLGAGFGASGAGALGVSLALNAALGLGIRKRDLIACAHVSEVVNRTGLGDVGAQARGGLVIGVEPGAPPYGKVRRIRTPPNLRIVCCTLGGISTKSFLSGELVEKAEELGREAVRRMLAAPTFSNFLRISRDFAEKLGLMDRELRGLCGMAVKGGALGASQAMLGRTVFAFCRPEGYREVERIFREVCGSALVTRVAESGPGLSRFPRERPC